MEFGLKRLEFLKGLKFIETPSYPEGSCYPERSTGLKDLIRLMLTVDPEKRISFKEILKHPPRLGKANTTCTRHQGGKKGGGKYNIKYTVYYKFISDIFE